MNESKKIIQDESRTITLSRTFFDISRLINENMAIYPGDPKPNFEQVLSIENNQVEVTRIMIGSHTGTHIDAQKHFISGGIGIDKEPLSKFIGQAYVIDLSNKILGEGICDSDLEEYSEILKDNDILLIYTDMDNKIQGSNRIYGYNYLEPSAAEWIVNHKIKCIGIDTFSVEKFKAKDGIVHKKLLSNDIGIIENLKSNFVQFANKKVFLICLPLLLENIDASPARAILFEIPTDTG
ncbi:MAG TPA: cyclase family protein [Nitrososphaeraceae archaeon]|nr:cyclase family protein [Nitrososphaeraceae archaeon]